MLRAYASPLTARVAAVPPVARKERCRQTGRTGKAREREDGRGRGRGPSVSGRRCCRRCRRR
ncbi:Hypothetical protein SCLAV_1036 [Streptomyces clavuligerus]|uniref:Uncharacterized protein n=1 Tax=Streptomyces clavuligerus TaxID=1901 RepID=E2PXJ2_STRCL|nr:Hypothetical protein SCLAV_1036 [Streptomyces clavuligerus]